MKYKTPTAFNFQSH